MSEQSLKERIKEGIEERNISHSLLHITAEERDLELVMFGMELGFEESRKLFDKNCSSMEWPYKYETFEDLKKEIE